MEPIRITSANNSILKEIRSLRDKKGRQNAKSFLLEGLRLVGEAVDSQADILYFAVSDSFFEKARSFLDSYPETKAVVLPDELFERIGETSTPQGILAVVRLPEYRAHEMLPRLRRIVVLENIQDPGNLGTIIRTADACGFDGVLLSKDCADPYNPKVVRSTMGSLFHLPVLEAEDIYRTLEDMKAEGVKIAAAHLKRAVPCWEADLSGSVAIVIGNEGNGITDKMLSIADVTVLIPMLGKAESLNASAAASILLYESMRQEHFNVESNNGHF